MVVVMDINKEREAFEKLPMIKEKLCWHIWFSGIDNKYDSYIDTVEEDRNFLNGAWMMFQAKATPEGFVLVPKEPTLKMSVAYEENAVAPCSSLSVSGYKAMIEAQEQSHD